MRRVGAEENPEWGYARNGQILLKAPQGEYSSSAYSTTLNLKGRPFYGANRDYSWQGLLVGPLRGSLFKALDGIYFSTGSTLDAKDVLFTPGSCIYRYVDDAGEPVQMGLSLESHPGALLLRAWFGGPGWFAPVLDSRPADSWVRGSDEAQIVRGRMEIANSATPLNLLISGFDSVERLGLELEWRYKLGDGFRSLSGDRVVFREHRHAVTIPWILHASAGTLRVEIPLPTVSLPQESGEKLPSLGPGPVAKALELRISTLASMGLILGDLWFPEAGAWWFRRPWTRDALEGLRWNLRTYVERLAWSRRIFLLLSSLGDICQRSLGLPTIAYGDGGFASDAPPILLKLLSEFGRLLGSGESISAALELARLLASTLLSGGQFSGSVLKDSIICSPANSSWVDSVTTLGDQRWPTRLPRVWRERGVDAFAAEFGLVEVNALYLEALQSLSISCNGNSLSIPHEVEELKEVLRDGFLRWFARRGTLPYLTVLPSEKLSDPTLGSPGIEAVYLLHDMIYDAGETRRIWTTASRRLIVFRELRILGGGWHPFGLLTRDLEPRPYLDDEDYHGPVVWPRDTPYLIGIMKATDQDPGGVLLNNLDHMVSEGAYGYSNELFSLPIDASGLRERDNPVPVKNPAQYWSHWCDPFLGCTDELEALADRTKKDNAS